MKGLWSNSWSPIRDPYVFVYWEVDRRFPVKLFTKPSVVSRPHEVNLPPFHYFLVKGHPIGDSNYNFLWPSIWVLFWSGVSYKVFILVVRTTPRPSTDLGSLLPSTPHPLCPRHQCVPIVSDSVFRPTVFRCIRNNLSHLGWPSVRPSLSESLVNYVLILFRCKTFQTPFWVHLTRVRLQWSTSEHVLSNPLVKLIHYTPFWHYLKPQNHQRTDVLLTNKIVVHMLQDLLLFWTPNLWSIL